MTRRANITGRVYANYALAVAATSTNVHDIGEEIQDGVKALFVPQLIDNVATQVSVVAGHFAAWLADKPIVPDAKDADLASMLLLASLHSRTLHVTDVWHEEDLMLIELSKSEESSWA